MFSDLTKSSPTFATLGEAKGGASDQTWHSHNTHDCRNTALENEDESTEPISAGKEDEEKTTKNDLRRRLEKK